MTIQQIKNKLLNEYKIKAEDIENLKSKEQFIDFLSCIEQDNNMKESDSFTIAETEFLKENKELTPLDPEWSKFILSKLSEDEKDGEFPKSDGLRRLVEAYMSPITNIHTQVIQCPSPTNNMTATVISTISLENGHIYSATADAKKSDLSFPFDMHISAICETRAEGRTYRKILRLKNTVTREEIVEKREEAEDRINKTQLMLIDNFCQTSKLDINVSKLLASIPDMPDNINKCSYEQGASINRLLNEYQGDLSKIPETIKGYDSNWK